MCYFQFLRVSLMLCYIPEVHKYIHWNNTPQSMIGMRFYLCVFNQDARVPAKYVFDKNINLEINPVNALKKP